MKGRILVLVQFGCLAALLLLPADGAVTPFRWAAAVVLVAIAAAILFVAAANLGRALTVVPEPRPDAPFVTHGIYHYLRHPMYTAVLMLGLALVLLHWNGWSLLIWMLLLADLQLKYRYEDRLLAAKWLGAHEYQQQVGALLPFRRSS